MKTILSSDLPTAQLDSTLKALKDYYNKLIDENERLANDARSQLEHVEALVSLTKLSSSSKLPLTPEISKANKTAAKVPAPATPKKSVPKIKAEAPTTKPVKDKPKAKSAPKAVKSETVKKSPGRQSSTNLKLLKQYQNVTLIGAIEQVLKRHEGSILSADNVVQTLYGDLKPDLFKVAKDRITKSLSKGKLEGKWDRVPDQQGCYTLSLSVL